MDEFTKMKEELNSIKKELAEKTKELTKSKEELAKSKEELAKFKGKGALCSVEGNAYEKQVHSIVSRVKLSGKNINFNTQKVEELAGSSSHNDIECNFNKEKDIGIECKKMKTPDWMQCSLKYKDNKWEGTDKGKIPKESRKIFDELINKMKLFNGQIPPFLTKDMTKKEWDDFKEKTLDFDDNYSNIPSDTIRKLYAAKGCYYIQISGGKGLYHLGNDVCDFKVPEFTCPLELRIRIKIHSSKNKKGFCSLSVTAACHPKNIIDLEPSKYSLDDINKLPPNLIKVDL
jgi:hypothetical protein